MAIHQTSDFSAQLLPTLHPVPEPGVTYQGAGVEVARALAQCAEGGQVVLSEQVSGLWQCQQEEACLRPIFDS
jgi:hypothetical protein